LSWNPDGSLHDVHYYATSASGYNDYDVVYNAIGKPASAVYASGMTDSWTYNADNSMHEVVQNSIIGKPWTTSDTLYGANGKPISETWYEGTAPVQTETWNADGSIHDLGHFGVTGHPYDHYDVVYGANNKEASATYSNGMTEAWTYNADASLHSISYAGITNENYATYTAGYDGNRQNVVQEFGLLNGSEVVRGYADQLIFTSGPNGETVVTPSSQSFSFDANHNATLTGGGLGETFVFKPGFGYDAITDFVPNVQANANHDEIAFSHNVFASTNDVLAHAAQSGSNTVITDSVGDSLVLLHVQAAHLSAHDFLLT
jgi:hypothetical protein